MSFMSLRKSFDFIFLATIAVFLILANHPAAAGNDENAVDPTAPRQVVLTWQGDTSTTMTITWRTDVEEGDHVLRYAEIIDEETGDFTEKAAETYTFDETSAWLHTVELTGLEPDAYYKVIIEHPDEPDEFRFRTAPSEDSRRELVFLAGGDSRSRRRVRREVNELAARENPDFIIFAGDFINNALNEGQWDDWFDDWHEQMITDDGRRIPVIPAIGNHEVQGSYRQDRENAPFYYNRFNIPEPEAYYDLDYGPDLTIITLDSEHTTLVTEQNEWLDETLRAKRDYPWKFVQYHVAAWPSVRDFDGGIPTAIRENWVPIFEEYEVDIVVEAHDHAYKRTVPIRDNQRDDERGVIYTGDGGWGAPTRNVKDPEDYWWLEEARRIDNFWKFTLSECGSELKVEPIFLGDEDGEPFTLTKELVAD